MKLEESYCRPGKIRCISHLRDLIKSKIFDQKPAVNLEKSLISPYPLIFHACGFLQMLSVKRSVERRGQSALGTPSGIAKTGHSRLRGNNGHVMAVAGERPRSQKTD
jgi:hypothetical protein